MMKTLFAKLTSSKFLLTAGTIGYGVFLIRQGNVTEGVAMITGAAGTYNIGQGMADAKPVTVEAPTAPLLPINGQN